MRLRNFTVLVCPIGKNCKICFEQEEALATGETRTLGCSEVIVGRHVFVRLNMNGILTLCEVRIFGLLTKGTKFLGICMTVVFCLFFPVS